MTADNSVINRIKKFYFEPLRGDKECLYGTNGKKILDFQCGVNGHILGYNNSVVEKTIIQQIQKGFFSQSTAFINKEKNKLTYRLCKNIGFCDKNNNINGTATYFASAMEANQYAMQTASKRYNTLCERNYNEIILVGDCINNKSNLNHTSFQWHNHSLTNIKEKIEIKYVEYNNLSNIENLITEHTSAIMLKPINWEQGFTICNKEYMQSLRQLCSYHKIGLIIDETNISIGYSGKMFIFQNYNIQPDIITLSTGLANGLPIAICITNEEFSKFLPNSPINGQDNNMPIAVTNAIIKQIQHSDIFANIDNYSRYIYETMIKIQHKYSDIIKNIYVYGLIFAIQFYNPIDAIHLSAVILSNGLSNVLTPTNTICFFPPLNITKDNLTKSLYIIKHSVNELTLLLKY